MNCPRCQAANPGGARFCEDCGHRLETTCAACGMPVLQAKKFCRWCGIPVSTPAPHAGRPESSTPRDPAETILASGGTLESERKQLTVLFADMSGSMELVAHRDPEDARELLDPVLDRMIEAVHRYEGTVNQVMGDGIMALFGAPVALEDHAVRACYAALRMQASVRRYAETVRRGEGVPIEIRVGVNSGEVVVRSIGGDLHMDYSAVGQVTHLAARLEQTAAAGSILISPATLVLAAGYVEVKPLGPWAVKGLQTPIEVYELTGAGPLRSRMEVAATRGLTRFVGRDAELEALRRALDRARAGHGQVVGVVGEPGVGKSRLFWEFIHSHHTDGWLVLESGAASYGRTTPYLPVIDLLKAYFQYEPDDESRKIREKVVDKLVALDPSLHSAVPAFLALLDAPVDDPQWQRLEPPHRRQRTLEALKSLLHRESEIQPVCVALEDLHWIDSETQAFLDTIMDSIPAARLLLLVHYRPEYQHTWGSKTFYTQLRIDPLPPACAEDLLQALLGSDSELAALKRDLIERAEGNPFFLEEGVRTLVETRVLVGQPGAYRLAAALLPVRVPATVQALLTARIDRLPPEDKRLLQTASVIGKDVPLALLQAVADEPEESFERGLKHLQQAELLYQARVFPDVTYTFKHGVTHQVVYASLLDDRRRLLQTRIVDEIERLSRQRRAEETERLSSHARGDDAG